MTSDNSLIHFLLLPRYHINQSSNWLKLKTIREALYDLGLYGYGDMELEAIIECYEDLKTEIELSPILKRMMVYYKEKIEEK